MLFCATLFFCFPQQSLSQEDSTYEIVFWETIKDSKDPNLYKIYLEKYPDGTFADIARILHKKYGGTEMQEKQQQRPSKSVQPVSTPKKAVKTGPKNIAIFPMKLKDDADYMRTVIISDITRVIARHQCLQVSHSYYDVDTRLRAKDLNSSSVISQSELHPRKIWKGGTPNAQAISKIGEQLGIDTVITGILWITNPWSDKYRADRMEFFIVDTATGKIVSAKNMDNLNDARDLLAPVIIEAVDKYVNSFCRN